MPVALRRGVGSCAVLNPRSERDIAMTPIDVRALVRADLSHVAHVLEVTGLFPSAMLADMAEPFLSGAAPHHWLVAAQGDQRLGFAYAEPERMTDGTANLLAIAVDPASQNPGRRHGAGRRARRAAEGAGEPRAAGRNVVARRLCRRAGLLRRAGVCRGSPHPRLLPGRRGQDHLLAAPLAAGGEPGLISRP